MTEGTVSPSAQAPAARTAAAPAGLMEQLVRVEANFLRLPLFALDTKRLRTMDGIRCEGTFRRQGLSVPFRYQVTRNVATMYPGPLARSAHFALLSMATERGLPVANPIVFSWRELCLRMGIQPSGRTVTLLREALVAIKGLMIESHHALYAKDQNRMLDAGEEYGQVLGIYDEVEFYGTTKADGSTADVNCVWLSRWYLENLNALYSGPLDHALWTKLDDRSPIASRLYEFLSYKFSGGRDYLRFNYSTLVKFIPVRCERYPSQQKQQLQPAFELLMTEGLLSRVDWIASKRGEPQILMHRGPLLSQTMPVDKAESFEVGEDDFQLNQIRESATPASELVRAFHTARGHAEFRPSKAELALADELIARHGTAFRDSLLPRVLKKLDAGWSDAKSFCAIARYLPEVQREIDREAEMRRRELAQSQAEQTARRTAVERAQERELLKVLWDSQAEDRRDAIRQRVLSRQPTSIHKFPNLIERFCLEELGREAGLDS